LRSDKEIQDLTRTEQVLFHTMGKIQTDRMEHTKAEAYAEGAKRDDHKRKKAAAMLKESALESVLRESGLYERYREWYWGK